MKKQQNIAFLTKTGIEQFMKKNKTKILQKHD